MTMQKNIMTNNGVTDPAVLKHNNTANLAVYTKLAVFCF